jgi:hypothetical protein
VTPVGVLGDSGPVSSPHEASKVVKSANATAEVTPLRSDLILILMSLLKRILVVPLDDDAPVLLSADRGGIWRNRRILA